MAASSRLGKQIEEFVCAALHRLSITRLSALLLLMLAGSATQAAQSNGMVTILPVYEGMARYADAATASPTADRQVLWKQHVLDPYWLPCTEGGAMVEFAPPLTTAFADVKALREAVTALREADIEPTVRAAMDKANALLPAPSTTVCLLAADSAWGYVRDLHGVGGFTAGAGKFWLTILPEGDWKDWITHTVAHEHHHSVWFSRHLGEDPINNMGDYLVFEGRADSFARLIDPTRRPPWTHALTPAQEVRAWSTMQRHLRAESAQLLQGLMFGGAEGVPRWAGYTIGFRIVQAFLERNPEMSISAWTALKAGELLQRSSYSP